MAPPKRQRLAGSGSNTRTRSSSDDSSSMGSRNIQFVSPAAQEEYNRLLAKPIAKERGFLPRVNNGNLYDMIVDRGWENFCESPPSVPVSVVKEFYANAKADRNGYSVVRGMRVDYTPPAIRRVLGLPEPQEGVEDWSVKTKADVDLQHIIGVLCVPETAWTNRHGSDEPSHFLASAMNKYARAWNLFICANILPSAHTHEVTVDRAVVLWGILNGHFFDLGVFVHRNIIKFLTGNPKTAIPHASIVTRLCTAVQVRWPEEEQVQTPRAAIDDAQITKMDEWAGGVPHPSGLGYEVVVTPPVQAEEVSVPPGYQQGAVNVSLDAQFRRMFRRIDAMHDINRTYSEDMARALGTAFQATGIQVQWPVFGAGAVYPPPDSPPPEEGGPSGS